MTSESGQAGSGPGDTAAGADLAVPMTAIVGSSTYAVTVVVLSDGRLGFVTPGGWRDEDVTAELRSDEVRRIGAAVLVRSGPAYEEVRGRLRVAAGLLGRWRLHRDRPVVVVTVTGPGDQQGQANRPSAR